MLIRWALQSGFPCVVKANTLPRVKEFGDVFDFTLTDRDMQQLVSYREASATQESDFGVVLCRMMSSSEGTTLADGIP